MRTVKEFLLPILSTALLAFAIVIGLLLSGCAEVIEYNAPESAVPYVDTMCFDEMCVTDFDF